mgnify:CR=1 FL=1
MDKDNHRTADVQDAQDECTRLLSVIIVNYRTPGLVIDAVTSLLPELDALDSQVVIVDNKSDDGSVATLTQWIDSLPSTTAGRIALVSAPKNGGFAYGNNLGISRFPAHYYLLLNSDTLVHEDAIGRLLQTMQHNPAVGLVGPQLEWNDGRVQESCFRRHGLITELLRGAQLTILHRLFKSYEIPITGEKTSARIDWISFACVLIRSQVIRDTGYLDDEFFMYFEDVDYCLRATQSGWKIMYDDQARVVHLRGGTSSVKRRTASRASLPKYYYQSRSRYFRLRGGQPYLVLANVLWYFGRLMSWGKLLAGRRDRAAVAGEWADIWVGATGPCESFAGREPRGIADGVAK